MNQHEVHIVSDKELWIFPRKKKKDLTKNEMYDVMKAMETYGGTILPNQYVEDQFEPWWDTMYIDFQIGEHVVALHWEHYTGIYLLSDTADESVLSAMWERIKPLIK